MRMGIIILTVYFIFSDPIDPNNLKSNKKKGFASIRSTVLLKLKLKLVLCWNVSGKKMLVHQRLARCIKVRSIVMQMGYTTAVILGLKGMVPSRSLKELLGKRALFSFQLCDSSGPTHPKNILRHGEFHMKTQCFKGDSVLYDNNYLKI